MEVSTTEDAFSISNELKDLPALLFRDKQAAEDAAQLLVAARKAKKILEEGKDAETKPVKVLLDSVIGKWQPAIASLVLAETRLKNALAEYQVRARQEQNDAIERARAASAVAAQEAGRAPEVALQAVQAAQGALAQAAARQPGELKGVHERVTWHWELESLNKVPDAYKMVVLNDKAVTEAVRKGERNIPGVRIFSKTGVVARTK